MLSAMMPGLEEQARSLWRPAGVSAPINAGLDDGPVEKGVSGVQGWPKTQC